MNEIGAYLKKIHILLERRRNYDYREYGLTSTQLDILEYLYFNDTSNNCLSDIASFFGVQHTSAIHVLKILEKKELISRCESQKRSRCKPILLTPKGKDIIHSHLGCHSGLPSLLFAGIPDKDLEILEKSLKRIYQNLLEDQPDGLKSMAETNIKKL